mgnify:CR=1 FL=1
MVRFGCRCRIDNASDTDEGKAKLSKDRCLSPKISSWREDIPFRAHCSVHRPRGRKWAGVGFVHTLEPSCIKSDRV